MLGVVRGAFRVHSYAWRSAIYPSACCGCVATAACADHEIEHRDRVFPDRALSGDRKVPDRTGGAACAYEARSREAELRRFRNSRKARGDYCSRRAGCRTRSGSRSEADGLGRSDLEELESRARVDCGNMRAAFRNYLTDLPSASNLSSLFFPACVLKDAS